MKLSPCLIGNTGVSSIFSARVIVPPPRKRTNREQHSPDTEHKEDSATRPECVLPPHHARSFGSHPACSLYHVLISGSVRRSRYDVANDCPHQQPIVSGLS